MLPLLAVATYPGYVDHASAFTEGFTPLSRRSQTGFIPISKASESFYWLFYADQDPSTKPILVWLQGQIGVTSLFGALLEFTPEWTEDFNLLFLDAPLGVGLSHTSLESDLVSSSEEIASQVMTFLEKFVDRHHEQFPLPRFIIAGEDYAGHTIPLIVNLAQQTTRENPFQIIGMAVGNGHTHAPIQVITKAESAMIFGLVDGEKCTSAARSHAWRASVLSVIGDTLGSLEERNELENTILNCSQNINMGEIFQKTPQDNISDPRFEKVQSWLNNSQHLHAINVPPRNCPVKNSTVFEKLKPDIMRVIWGHIPPILDAGNITTLWYQGQLDWIDGVYSNEAWLNALEWSGSSQYSQAERQQWEGGYIRSYGPLNEAMVLGAGHLALIDKPRQVLELYRRVLLDQQRIGQASLPEQTTLVF